MTLCEKLTCSFLLVGTFTGTSRVLPVLASQEMVLSWAGVWEIYAHGVPWENSGWGSSTNPAWSLCHPREMGISPENEPGVFSLASAIKIRFFFIFISSYSSYSDESFKPQSQLCGQSSWEVRVSGLFESHVLPPEAATGCLWSPTVVPKKRGSQKLRFFCGYEEADISVSFRIVTEQCFTPPGSILPVEQRNKIFCKI